MQLSSEETDRIHTVLKNKIQNKIPFWLDFDVINPQGLSHNHHRWDVRWSYKNTPLCEYPLSIHTTDGQFHMSGFLPPLELKEPPAFSTEIPQGELQETLQSYFEQNHEWEVSDFTLKLEGA
jgi:hypothetical protein